MIRASPFPQGGGDEFKEASSLKAGAVRSQGVFMKLLGDLLFALIAFVVFGVPIVGAFVLGFLAHLKSRGVKFVLKGSDFEP